MMNFCSPQSREGVDSGGARGLRSDSAGSDDSGFGDDSLPPDEYIQLRLQKMNTLMGFGGEPGINELDVVGANGIATASSLLDAGLGAHDNALLVEQKGPPPPYSSGDKKPMTAYERLQALSLQEGNPSALQLVDEASSLPAPGGERFFGAAVSAPPPAPQPDFDYGSLGNRTFMADDDEDDDEDDAYVITWEGGQLGLLFKANPAGQVVIRRVNKKGTALGLQSARAGDVLVGLNGITVQGVPFLEIIEQLKNPRFPIKLEFEPLKFGALPPGIIGSSALPSYTSYNMGIPGMGGSRDAPSSPTSSSGTVEVTDQESSFVHVSKPAEEFHEDSLRKKAEYDVVWDEGPLGCGLKNRSGYPTVKTVSSIGVSASVAQIGEGDILIIINGYKTLDIGFKSAITMLQRAPKPIYLRFRRQLSQASSADAVGNARGATKPSSSSSRDLLSGAQLGPLQYAVLWSDGPLGIQIKSGNKGLVFVSRLTGAGNPAMTKQITPGDIFVRIADVDVASRGIAGAFELLKSVQKPVVLVFQKVNRHDDDAMAAIPSFRRMREEASGGPSSSAGAHPLGITRANSAGVRGSNSNHSRTEYEEAPWQTRTMPNRPSAIDETIRMQKVIAPRSLSCDLDCEDESESGSQQSNARTDYSGVSQQVNVPGDHPPADSNLGDSLPPRFSDIEAGRVVTAEVTALPPPPSYLDMFTQSGRSRDFGEAFCAPTPGSPRSEGQSVSSSHLGDQQAAFPPPPPLPAHEMDSFAALPPPPQYSSFFPADGGGGSRLQELRQQYIESERRRNQTEFGSTFMSSYSDLDDSDVMRQRKSSVPRAPPNSLPLSRPELWVRWSEGPLGITFKRKNGQIVVSRLTGAGFSPGLEQLRTGDWLVSFNNNSTENLRLSETMEMLKRLPKPIDMRFVVQ